MFTNKSSKAWLFLVASVGFLGLGFYWPTLYSSLKPANSLATVVSTKGTTEWISRQRLHKQKPKKSLALSMNESLATGSDGEMVIRFRKGAEVRLLPSTFVTLTRKAHSTLLAVRRGDIEVIKEGEANSVLIAQDGQDKPLRDFESKEVASDLWIDPQSLDTIKTVDTNVAVAGSLEGASLDSTPPTSPVAAVMNSKAISQKGTSDLQGQVRTMIADRIAKRKNHLFRCYSALVQKQKQAHGKLDVHFIVNNQGKVKDPTIVKTEIKDKKFQQCLIQIIQRTDFQSFEGQEVSTLLPLRFEKNLNTVQ